jgi:hypothetical protein
MDADKSPSDQPPAAPAVTSPSDPKTPLCRIDGETEQGAALKKFEQLSLVIQRRTFWVTLALAVVTTCYAGFAFLQWIELSKTAELMRESNQTNAINSLRAQRGVNDSLLLAKQSFDATKGIADSTKDVATAAKTSAANAAALANSIANIQRLEYRPRMSLTRIEGKPEVDKVFTVRVVLTNSGKSPAYDLFTSLAVGGKPSGQPPRFIYPRLPSLSRGSIPPSQEVSLIRSITDSSDRPIPLSAEHMAALTSNQMRLWVWGCVAYTDSVNRKRHWNEFCVWWDVNGYNACDSHNGSDDISTGPQPCPDSDTSKP